MPSKDPRTNRLKKWGAKQVKKHMKDAFDDYQKRMSYYDEEGRMTWESNKDNQDELFDELANEIMKCFPGYVISGGTVQSHFVKTNEPPLFLIPWYANKFGISIDVFLTGHRNSKVSSASSEVEAVHAYIKESSDLMNELKDTVEGIVQTSWMEEMIKEEEAKRNGK